MSIEMSGENPILGTQRYFRWKQYENGYVDQNVSREPDFRYTTALLKKMKENDRKCTKTYTKHTHTHTAKSKIPENPGVPRFRVQKCKNTCFSKHNCCCFTSVHIKRNVVFLTVLCFLYFRRMIFTKHASFLQKKHNKTTGFKHFSAQTK